MQFFPSRIPSVQFKQRDNGMTPLICMIMTAVNGKLIMAAVNGKLG